MVSFWLHRFFYTTSRYSTTAENTTSKEINDRNVNNPPAPAKKTTTKCQRAWHMLPVLPARNTGPHWVPDARRETQAAQR